jgi:hypothetical protein
MRTSWEDVGAESVGFMFPVNFVVKSFEVSSARRRNVPMYK